MQEGEIKPITIYAEKNIYFFIADGYMHGRMVDVLSSNINTDKLNQLIEERKNEIDKSTRTIDRWVDSFQSERQGFESYSASDGYRTEASRTDGLYGEEQGSNTERNSIEGSRYNHTREEVDELVQRLKEVWGLNNQKALSKDDVFFDGNKSTQFSLSEDTTQRDAEYLKAVESGDMETAQKQTVKKFFIIFSQ